MFVVVVAQHAAPLPGTFANSAACANPHRSRKKKHKPKYFLFLLKTYNGKLSQFGRLVSSTSTYSASITSPGFFSCAPLEPAEEPPPAPAPAAAPACPAAPAACDVLYSSSAILCSERSTFSVADRSRATPPSLMAFFASSMSSSAFF